LLARLHLSLACILVVALLNTFVYFVGAMHLFF
jgi:hypothetical protein